MLGNENITKKAKILKVNNRVLPKIYYHLFKKLKLQQSILVKKSLSTVLPIVFGLANKSSSFAIAIQSFKWTVKAAILRKWNAEEISSVSLISTALDPRFKLIKYVDESTKVSVIELVVSNNYREIGW